MDSFGHPDPATTPPADLDIAAALTRAATAARVAAGQERQALRQLAELRATYPGWVIDRRHEETGEWWVAELQRPVTEEMALIGVVGTTRQRDGAALALTLSYQTALIQRSEP
jgi:hypothetical protein